MLHQAGSKEKFQLLDLVPVATFVLDSDFVVIFWNRCLANLSGVSASRMEGSDIREAYPRLAEPDFASSLEKVFREGATAEVSFPADQLITLKSQDGEFAWLKATVAPYASSESTGCQAIISIQKADETFSPTEECIEIADNLAEQRESSKLLEKQVDQLRTRLNDMALSTGDWLWEVDGQLCYTYASSSVEMILGYAPQELIGKRPIDFVAKDDADKLADALDEAVKQKAPIMDLEIWKLTREGQKVCLLINGLPVLDEFGEVIGYRGVAKDVTQRKNIETALIQSRQRFNRLGESLGDKIMIYSLSREAKFNFASPGVQTIFGLDPDEVAGGRWTELIRWTPESRVTLLELDEKIFKQGKTFTLEASFVHPDGGVRTVLINGYPAYGPEGKVVASEGLCHDITRQKQAEEARREIEQRFTRLVDELGDSIVVYSHNADNVFTYASPGMAAVFGLKADEAIGRDWREVIHFTPESLPVVQESVRVSVENKRSVSFEADYNHPDGTVHTVMVTAYPVVDEHGSVTDSEGFCQDITLQRRYQEALRKSEARYALAQRAAKIGTWEWDIKSGELFWSEQIDALFGFGPGEFKRTYPDFLVCVHPGDREFVQKSIQQSLDGEIEYDIEHRIVWPDGQMRWVAETGEVHRDGNGKPVRMYGVVRDVTRRRLAMTSQSQLIEIIENSPELVVIGHIDNMTLHYLNPAGRKLLGLGQDEDIAGLRIQDFLPPRVRPYFENEFIPLVVRQGFWQGEIILQLKDGRRVPTWMVVITHKNQRGELERVSAMARDVSPLKNATEELRKLHRAVEQSQASIVITNLEGSIEYVNPYFYQLTGYTPQEVVGQNPRILSSGIHDPEFFKEMWDTIVAGETWRGEICNRKKNGQLYWESASISPLKDDRGQITHIVAVKEDITEQRQAQARLRELLSEFETLFNASSVAIAYYKGDRYCHRINRRFSEIFGYEPEEVIGKQAEILHISKQRYQEFIDRYAGLLINGETVKAEYELRHKDGHTIWCSLYGKAVMPPDLTAGVIWVADDITHRKELDQLKSDVERMMRHDLKTPLNALINMPQLIEMEGNLTEQQVELVRSLEGSGLRMLNMIDMSLAFFKMETGSYEYHPQMVNLVSVIQDVTEESRSRLSAKDLRMDLGSPDGSIDLEGPVWVMAEGLLLHTALSNLLVNAAEASPPGALITVSLGLDSGEQGDAVVGLALHNQGSVPQEIRGVFFQKYVTHGKQKGTGLGTYSAKLIVETMGGEISMATSDAKGTTVTVNLPKANMH